MKPTLFVSDVHLSAARPWAVDAFLRLLAGPARRAEALYVLGDLFDQWLGDDDETPPHAQAEAVLAALTASGTYVGVLQGNHDFLIRERFAARTGCDLLPDPVVIDLYGAPTLLMHGDSLCIDDQEYQAFRVYARDPENQRRFLAQSLAERAAAAAALRLRSEAATPLKPDDIMDVNLDAVVAALREHRSRHLIHGHTHRPGVHALSVDGEPARRTVLGDWYERDHVLVADAEGFAMGPVAETTRRMG